MGNAPLRMHYLMGGVTNLIYQLEYRSRSLIGMAVGFIAAVFALLAMTSTAHAFTSADFCTGVNLNPTGSPSSSCIGYEQPGYIHAVYANGNHSVCAWITPVRSFAKKCSAGANEGVMNESMASAHPIGYPMLENNDPHSNTIAYGHVYFANRSEWEEPGAPPPPPPSTWHSDNLGGTLTSDPDISSWGSNRLDVFARGTEGALWHRYFSGGWQPWEKQGGSPEGGPGAVSWGLNRIDVVTRLANNTIQHWYYEGSGWASDNLGGTISSDADISSWGPNRLDIFARGSGGELLHKYWAGSGWSGWENMGGSIVGGPSAVSWGPNRIDVVARATNNTIEHWYWTGAGWTHDNLGGNVTSSPDISSWGTNRLDVFARGADGALWHQYWSGSGTWSGWESMGGSIVGGPGTVSSEYGRIDVVARDASNNSIDHWYWAP